MSTIHIFLITLENTEGAIKNGQRNTTKTQRDMCWTPLYAHTRK